MEYGKEKRNKKRSEPLSRVIPCIVTIVCGQPRVYFHRFCSKKKFMLISLITAYGLLYEAISCRKWSVWLLLAKIKFLRTVATEILRTVDKSKTPWIISSSLYMYMWVGCVPACVGGWHGNLNRYISRYILWNFIL